MTFTVITPERFLMTCRFCGESYMGYEGCDEACFSRECRQKVRIEQRLAKRRRQSADGTKGTAAIPDGLYRLSWLRTKVLTNTLDYFERMGPSRQSADGLK